MLLRLRECLEITRILLWPDYLSNNLNFYGESQIDFNQFLFIKF